jgi:hypothetical protein
MKIMHYRNLSLFSSDVMDERGMHTFTSQVGRFVVEVESKLKGLQGSNGSRD